MQKFLLKNPGFATSGRHNSAMITHAENSLLNDPPTRCLVSIFTVIINSKSLTGLYDPDSKLTPKFFPIFRTKYRIDNAHISQPHAANHNRLLKWPIFDFSRWRPSATLDF